MTMRLFSTLAFLVAVTAIAGASVAHAEGPACPYAVAHQAPLDVQESTVAEEAEFKHLRVELNGIKGDRVPGWLYVPAKKGEGRRPAVLLQYGSGGHKGVNYIVALGKQFVARGFVVLTIDAPGRGDRKREGGADVRDWLTSDKGRDHFLQHCGDYSRAVDYLLSRADVDAERLCYVGISWGAITGITYAAHDPRVKAFCSIVGGGGFLGLTEVARGRFTDSIDPLSHVGRIAPRPLLLLNAKKDQIIRRPFSWALHQAAGKGAKKVWLDTDHMFNGIDRAAMGESVIQFCLESLSDRPD
jgi:dienelactone hydrolase